MRGFFSVFLIAAVTFSCKENRERRQLSFVIQLDSISIYEGELDSSTIVKNYYFDTSVLRQLLLSENKKFGSDFEVLIKPLAYADVLARTLELKCFLDSNQIKSFLTPKLTDAESKYFDATSFEKIAEEMEKFPIERNDDGSLKLFLPKIEKGDNDTLICEDCLTILMIDEDCIYSYTGKDIQLGKLYCGYDNKLLSKIINEYKSKVSNPGQQVVLKPLPNSTFEIVIKLLDAMTENKVKEYSLVDFTSSEKLHCDSLMNKNLK